MAEQVRPEVSFGPVAVWRNQQGDGRVLRSITIKAKQYKDAHTGEWRDSKSWNVSDLPYLSICIIEACRYCLQTIAVEGGVRKYSQSSLDLTQSLSEPSQDIDASSLFN